MGHARNRQVFRQSLRLESLEKREVFAGDVLDVALPMLQSYVIDSSAPITETPRDYLEEYISSKLYEFPTPSENVVSPSSETDLDTKLKALVGNYWNGILGKLPSELPEAQRLELMISRTPVTLLADSISVTSGALTTTRTITNTRHETIDEGDFSDTTSDGYLYTVVGRTIHVANLRDPSQISAKAVISTDGYASQMLVFNNSLLLIENISVTTSVSMYGIPRYASQTKISLYDISDRLSPQAVSTTVVDGANMATRLANGQLTLVQNQENVLPKPVLVTDDAGVERYQSLDSYYETNRDAILSVLQIDYAQSEGSQAVGAGIDAGTWDDLAFINDSLGRSTSVLRFDVTETGLNLTDTETLTGLTTSLIYQGLEDIYLVAIGQWTTTGSNTYIYKVDATGNGQLEATTGVIIKGQINDTTWLNEHNGVLQVASVSQLPMAQSLNADWDAGRAVVDPIWVFLPSTIGNSANITTVGDTADGWKILGTLENIGDGQSMLAANFIGDQAVITTGTPMFIDPLHGIDLSNPAAPVEVSELIIPGFTTYLKQIDSTHWLGFGYDQDTETRLSYLQVSLYRVDDLANPELVDTWKSTVGSWGMGRSWDPHSISYDPATGLLVMTSAQEYSDGGTLTLPVLKIDVDAEDAVSQVGSPVLNESLLRAFTLDNVLVTVSEHRISTYDVSNLTSRLGQTFLENYDLMNYVSLVVQTGSSQDLTFENVWHGEPFTITSVVTSGAVTAVLSEDGSKVTFTAPDGALGLAQSFTLTINFQSGIIKTVTGTVYTQGPIVNPVDAQGRASIGAQFTDDAGNVVTELASGDEVWVNITVTDQRENGAAVGVFGAYVNVVFDSENVTVVGDLEYADFTNGKTGTITSRGIESFGGFDGPTLPGSTTSQLGRFKIRINDDQPVLINITPATGIGRELLLYNGTAGVDPTKITPAVLSTQSETMRTLVNADNQKQDVNSDGAITPLDVLLVVNYINASVATSAEAPARIAATPALSPTESRYDISGDGVVSAMDVLRIVNTINSRNSLPANGEGSSLTPAAVDQLFSVDWESDARRKRS